MNPAPIPSSELNRRAAQPRPGLRSTRGRSAAGAAVGASSTEAHGLHGLHGLAASEGAVSWSSLVATTLGLDDFGRVWVRVRAEVAGADPCRLVVQLYPSGSDGNGQLLSAHARPLASAQRAVRASELRDGLDVMLVHWLARHETVEGALLVAWVEPGEADLEFDGLRARPAHAHYVGMCRFEHERASLVLQRSAA